MKEDSSKKTICQSNHCVCGENSNKIIQDLAAVSSNKENLETIKELDPTHFGDWQVKGRTIDF